MSIVTLAEVKRYGNFKSSDDDTDVQATIDAAETIAAKWVGPLTSTAVTQRIYDASLAAVLVLNTRPVISVESVTGADGGVVPLANLDIDLVNGVIYPDTTGWMNRWLTARYTIAYHAGYATLPGDIRLGIIKLTSALWKGRRGPTRPSGDTGGDMIPPLLSSRADLPADVRALWEPYIRPGIG